MKDFLNKIIQAFTQRKKFDYNIPGLNQKLDDFQKVIKYRFSNLDLLKVALTHDSYTHDYYSPRIDNGCDPDTPYERMEFLGDAVLGLVVSEYLYCHYPTKDEGFLSKLKSNIVSEKYLVVKANLFNLGNYIIMSEKEERNGGRERKSIICDTMEAIICAIYLDSGLNRACEFINTFILEDFERQVQMDELVNFKSILQEYSQSIHQSIPEYRLISESGPDHNKTFVMEVYLNSQKFGVGEGPNKKDAQQQAAHNACKKLKLS
jgi:ribonuclease-3